MRQFEYSLPEIAFLNGFSHHGNLLEDRTVIHHMKSCTCLEAFEISERPAETTANGIFNYHFERIDIYGKVRFYKFALYWTSADDENLVFVVQEVEEWYRNYLYWQDRHKHDDRR